MTTTPCRDAFRTAVAALATIEKSLDDISAHPDVAPLYAAYMAAPDDNDSAEEAAYDVAYDAIEARLETERTAARQVVTEKRAALRASGEPRRYTARDDQGTRYAFEACSPADARDAAESWIREGSYETTRTTWIDAWIDGEDGTDEQLTVAIDPQEPACSAGDHDWQAPHEIVGGLEENPGVRGHGGGVTIHEVCMHCGCARLTDTWATRPDTGQQGLRSVSYEPGRHADEVRAA